MSLSPVKPARRALLDKTTNALLSPSKHNNISMEKPLHRVAPSSPPLVAGQKRSIDQMDTDQNKPGSTHSSFNQVKREDEFYIYDEITQSSMDLDKEASFLLPSEPIHEVMAKVDKGSSQESTSMSSLLNLSFESEKNNPTSQHNTSTTTKNKQSEPEKPQTKPSLVPTDPEARKLFIQQKAGLLRRRVQSAMKSINDHNQIDRRVSNLEAHSRDRLNMGSTNQQQQPQTDDDKTPKASGVNKLIPSPVFNDKSTSYSTRVMRANMPSSPPMSATGESNDGNRMEIDEEPTAAAAATPKRLKTDHHPETPTSPIVSINHTAGSNEAAPIIVDRDAMCSVEKMIAKAKTGEAVDGLLKLMKTSSEYDALDEWAGQ